MSVEVDRREFYYRHVARARGVQTTQYVYEIGSYHYNWHAEPEVLLVLNGEVEVCAAGEVALMRTGDITVINSRVGHATLATQPRSLALLLHLDPQFLASFQHDGAVPTFHCRSTPLTVRTPPFATLRREMARMMIDAPDDGEPGAVLEYERSILSIVGVLLREFTAHSQPAITADDPMQDDAFRRVTEYIERHYRQRIPLKKLGEIAGYNAVYLSQLFTQKLGMTTSEYIRRVRLAHAVRDLSLSSERVSDIALANGFPDVKAFNSAFGRAFRKTPSQYRLQVQERANELKAVDDAFHLEFVSRSDALAASILERFARPTTLVECGECVPIGRDRITSLDASMQTARELLRQLEYASGRETLVDS